MWKFGKATANEFKKKNENVKCERKPNEHSTQKYVCKEYRDWIWKSTWNNKTVELSWFEGNNDAINVLVQTTSAKKLKGIRTKTIRKHQLNDPKRLRTSQTKWTGYGKRRKVKKQSECKSFLKWTRKIPQQTRRQRNKFDDFFLFLVLKRFRSSCRQSFSLFSRSVFRFMLAALRFRFRFYFLLFFFSFFSCMILIPFRATQALFDSISYSFNGIEVETSLFCLHFVCALYFAHTRTHKKDLIVSFSVENGFADDWTYSFHIFSSLSCVCLFECMFRIRFNSIQFHSNCTTHYPLHNE